MLTIGMHVDIQRSDGRIHGAIISDIKRNGRYMVEWYEKGETKGKESSLEELLKLNPTIQLAKASMKETKKKDMDEDTFLLDMVSNNHKNKSSRKTVYKSEAPEFVEPAPRKTLNSTKNYAPEVVESAPRKTINATRNQDPVEYGDPAPRVRKQSPPQIENRRPEIKPLKPMRAPSPSPPQIISTPQSYPQQDVPKTNANFAFAEMVKEFRAQVDYRPLTLNDSVSESRISVCVRKRPLNKSDKSKGEIDVITVPSKDIMIVHQPQVRVDLAKYVEHHKFRFDYAFDETATNETVYKFTAQPLVKTIFEQGTATCFAYGQTGSGKTHTMGGDFSGKRQNASMGIYGLTARDVFAMLEKPQYRRKGLSVHCAFFEIYGIKVFDLLNNKKQLRVLEDNKSKVQVVGLMEEATTNEEEVLNLIDKGSQNRSAGSTSANANSSRSHAVFQIILRQDKKMWGKFSLIDLAGNERGTDNRDNDAGVRHEGAAINTSLLALKECIRAMARNSSHVPFRQSKLTLVLRDSFIGNNARTVMISMISPGISSTENSLNTLRYADRVKEMGAEGSGDATPIRDEDIFLPPAVNNDELDEEEEQAIAAEEKWERNRELVDVLKQIAESSENMQAIILSENDEGRQENYEHQLKSMYRMFDAAFAKIKKI